MERNESINKMIAYHEANCIGKVVMIIKECFKGYKPYRKSG